MRPNPLQPGLARLAGLVPLACLVGLAGCGEPKPQPKAQKTTECSPDMARVVPAAQAPGEAPPAPFCLDRTEVTVAAYAECVGKAQCLAMPQGRGCNRDDLQLSRHPANCVTWAEAEAFCKAQNKRLPTDREWTLAASSQLVQPDACWSGRAPRAATCAVDAASEGLDGIPGNVAEWTSGESPAGRVVRGGSYRSVDPTDLRPTNSSAVAADLRAPWVGFRCAR